MNTARKQTVADIILSQLGGGGRLTAMIGARHFYHTNNGNTLCFQFPNRLRSKPNHIKITLTGMDDYTIEFGRIVNKKSTPVYKVVKTLQGIYCDQLVDIFEAETGLYLTLFPKK
jgi:hypothetical protein